MREFRNFRKFDHHVYAQDFGNYFAEVPIKKFL